LSLAAAAAGQIRRTLIAGHDEMVEDPDVDQCQRRLEVLRQELVGTARLGRAARVVVCQRHRGGVALQRALHDLARVDRGLRQRAAEHLHGTEQPILGVEKQHDENLVLEPGAVQTQPVAQRLR